jgi:predicted nucleic acid-binding Zn ribbon protein
MNRPAPALQTDDQDQAQACPVDPLEGIRPSWDELSRIEPARSSVHAQVIAPYLRRPDLADPPQDGADPLHHLKPSTRAELVRLQAVEVLKLRQENHGVDARYDLTTPHNPPACAVCSGPIGLDRLLYCSDRCKFRLERRRKSIASDLLFAQDIARQCEVMQAETRAYRLALEVEELKAQRDALVDLLSPVAASLPVPLQEVPK